MTAIHHTPLYSAVFLGPIYWLTINHKPAWVHTLRCDQTWGRSSSSCDWPSPRACIPLLYPGTWWSSEPGLCSPSLLWKWHIRLLSTLFQDWTTTLNRKKCTYLARLKASSIIWARLITGMSWKLAIGIKFGDHSFGKTAEIMRRYVQEEVLYLMFGAQFVEETFPVLWVIVDSVETLHIYVGHQPVINTKCQFCICSCLDSNSKK